MRYTHDPTVMPGVVDGVLYVAGDSTPRLRAMRRAPVRVRPDVALPVVSPWWVLRARRVLPVVLVDRVLRGLG